MHPAERRHILTVSVEDYFHGGAFEGRVLRKHWDRFESRIEHNVQRTLKLLGRFDARATFFVLGWIAERQPDLVRRILEHGHEIASSGYWPRGLRGMVPEELREDLRRSRAILEAAGAAPIRGYRSPRSWLTEEDLWVLDVLAEEGYAYDSSLNPILRRFAREPRRFEVHEHRHSARDLTIREIPISTFSLFGLRLAISGGNYIRQLPHTLLRLAVDRWHRTRSAPLVFYLMPWELDRDQPHVRTLSTLNRIRHYRNLAKTHWVLEEYLQKYSFQTIADHLGLERAAPAAEPRRSPAALELQALSRQLAEPEPPAADRQPVTLVVPLYNEAETVGYCSRTLLELRRRLAHRYRIFLNLVDDGSSDDTYDRLTRSLAHVPDVNILRHERNRGVAAAILTGIRSAPTEVVCSIDCDCSYDPNVLETMLPMIATADLVTASPYHPDGRVFNVPPWRLFLSKTLSRLYSALLRQRLHTYTSCCRVYKRSAVAGLTIQNGGFLGVAEILIQTKLRGGVVAELPATLESRLFGESKMKVVRTICSHLGLLWQLARGKLRVVPAAPVAAPPPTETVT
jgi:polysaccharide deacetylase family protein (PEP-CTERM system associated)